MPTLIVRRPEHVVALTERIAALKLPVTVSWTRGESLSKRQQRLSFRWYQDIERQLGDQDVETIRADCKVTFGVPILSTDSDGFREDWARSIGRFSYEGQRKIVKSLQVPVTSLMSVKQMARYLDAMEQHYRPQGVRLTDPDALRYEEEFS